MADVISTLFGITPQSVNNQLDTRAVDIGKLWGAATVNPYATPAVQNAYRDQQAAQFALGSMGARAVGGMFGLQDPRLKRAADLERILNETQSEAGQDPVMLYSTLADKLSAAGYGKEAMIAKQEAAKLGLDLGVKQAAMTKDYAAASKSQQEAQIAQQNAAREEQLRAELAALPANATEEDYLNVVRRYAPAKDVMSTIERRQTAEQARIAKSEDLQTKLQADYERADERNKTLIEQARLQGATSLQLKQMEIASREQLAGMKLEQQRQLAENKAATKAEAKGAPKDVAEAEAALAGLEIVTQDIQKAKDLLITGKAKFGVKENAIAAAQSRVGNINDNTKNQLEVKRQIRTGVNNLLLLARGTQTEGDAKRAQELYVSAETANSNEAWKLAMDALLRAQEKLKAEKSTYVKSRGFGGNKLSAQDKQALDWANANQNDPRAAQIKQKLGM